ncbi:transcriptional regulator GcvA [Psychrosphaera sp. F3M07]|jgi:LysR family glycine cleavage system transcriptional activator|uniref:Transcriptional regulator GcvA n=1 Tax=Psychrosphaera aquimarina TaxID=2044854 RepID=A0ABU3QW14_9GAMM|nr:MULTISPECIES: transcriptional regulator GcvA [Psychrosphaera]MBU2918639.1 transcriptional regulator GcvA [Psychrosphaera sp. F3M07]MDU0111632.1 transcriptional regulator GcvA [Psychrosphaera aquimarina]
MARRLPPLNSLKAFEAAARNLSFTKAAEELFVTQAAISHQIKLLEEHLSMKLFMRRNRSLLLTEEGQSYYLDIKDIFAHLYEATERLLTRGAKGSISIALTPSFAIQWLIPRLSEFSNLHPDIDVKIKAVDYDDNSLTDDVDVAIYYGLGNWQGVFTDKLYTEYLTPVCSPLLLSGEKALSEPSDLMNHTLLHDMSRNNWKEWIKVAGVKDINVNQGPIFSHSSMVLQAAIHGQGIALGNSVLAKPEIESGRLVTPFNEVLVSKNAFYLVCREAQVDSPKIVAFRNWLLEAVRAEQESV